MVGRDPNSSYCLFQIFDDEYTAVCKGKAADSLRDVVKYVLFRNILCGNALSLMKVDLLGEDTDEPIVFAEWTFPKNDSMVKRRDFRLDVLLKENADESNYDSQFSLFADESMNLAYWETDPVTHEVIPKPIKEYPLIHYRRIAEYGE